MRFISQILTVAFLLAAGTAAAQDYHAGDIEIGHPWTRATPPTARVGAGYLTLTNKGDHSDRLLGGSSPAAGKVEIHTMDMTDGVMRMRHLPDGIAIPPGGTVELAPGGLHLMLKELTAPIAEGDHIPLTLDFERAGPVDVELPAAPLGASEPGGHEDGHGHEEAR